jgi:hypothetical protein
MTRNTTKTEETSYKIAYKGPAIHNRVITRKNLEDAGVEFGEGDKDFTEMRFAPKPGRVPHVMKGLNKTTQDQIVELLSQDAAFEISKDGEVVSAASPDAARTLADGSNAATGAGGSPELAEAIGMAQGSAGDATAGTKGTSGGVGGSTAGA